MLIFLRPQVFRIALFLCVLSCGFQSSLPAQETQGPVEPFQWAVLTGYGSSHPGWGETEERVEGVDLVGRVEKTLIREIGSSWYGGEHSLLVEPAVFFLTNPDESPLVSLSFLACYTFTGAESFRPYLFGGGGPVYIGGEIDGVGARWNGNYQFGVGLRWRMEPAHSLLFEVRYHHISNGNTSDPNIPLNSTKFLVGFTF